MRFFDIRKLYREYSSYPTAQFEQKFDSYAKLIGQEAFMQAVARHIVEITVPEVALPKSLSRFSLLIREGVTLFLSRIPYHRIKKVILSQLELPEKSDVGERLLKVILHFPTLQKLGQVVVRNYTIDPDIKKWLISLEADLTPSDAKIQIGQIQEWLEEKYPEIHFELFPKLLASGSVADILRYADQNSMEQAYHQGIFKILKPDIKHILIEELAILAGVLTTLEENRADYNLEKMQLSSLFELVRNDLTREIDLEAEQSHLREAHALYEDNTRVIIPQLGKCHSPQVTSMEFWAGEKVTDVAASISQRQDLAQLVFAAVICTPLFSRHDNVLFHGDPHAGNILVMASNQPERERIVLVDWTLASYLPKKTRIELINMIHGVLLDDCHKISQAIICLCNEHNSLISQHDLNEATSNHMLLAEYHKFNPLKRTFWLLEKMTMDGLVFPAPLILFRKAFYTLEGVLEDISPGFNVEVALHEYLGNIMIEEIPQRLCNSFFPLSDRAENYRSMLSNHDMAILSLDNFMSHWSRGIQDGISLLEIQTKLMTDFFSSFYKSKFW
jgi:ubiquinone biosynthesis protein